MMDEFTEAYRYRHPRLGRIGTPALRRALQTVLGLTWVAKLGQGVSVTVQASYFVNPIGRDAVSWPTDSSPLQMRDDGGPGDVEAGSQFTVGRSGLEGGDEFVDQVGAQPVLNQPELKSRASSEGWSAGLPSHVEIRSYAGFAGLERACTTSSCVVETTTLSLLGTPISFPV